MTPRRNNAKITKVTRPGKTDKYGKMAYYTTEIDEPCRFVRQSRILHDQDGTKTMVDATCEVGCDVGLTPADKIELSLPREPTYTVFSIEDVVSLTGVTTAHRVSLIKQQS